MDALLPLLAAPLAACLLLTGIHCYLGLHVVSRGVIFVDLALAQIAALGGAVALLAGLDLDSPAAYFLSLGFTFAGAAVFALARVRDERIPQEAIIGIAYAVASAASLLLLDRSPHGHEEVKAMLLGSILFVDWPALGKVLLIYTAVGIVHYLLRDKFLLISRDLPRARALGLRVRLWDLVFYATFGLVVTSSVRIAGILLVFTLLVVPAVCAVLFCQGVFARLLAGWGIGLLGCLLGLLASARGDLPTGPAIVTAFGALLVLCALVRTLGQRLARGRGGSRRHREKAEEPSG